MLNHAPGSDSAWEQLFHSAPLEHDINLQKTTLHSRFGPVFYPAGLTAAPAFSSSGAVSLRTATSQLSDALLTLPS